MELLVLVATVALVTCESSSDHDTLSEMREEFAQIKAAMKQFAEMKAEIAELKAENTAMKAQRNATTAGELKFFVDGRTVCPDGTVEVNATKGRVLLGRPDGGKTGAVFNRPLDAGEVGRSPSHSHAVAVNGPGHTRVGDCGGPGAPAFDWYDAGCGRGAVRCFSTARRAGILFVKHQQNRHLHREHPRQVRRLRLH